MASINIFAFVALSSINSISAYNINITSPPVTNWGIWGFHQRCPSGRYAQGFQLRTQPNQLLGDDTALNTIRLFCGDPEQNDTVVITSTIGDFGDWGNVYTCYPGVLNGFQLRSESNRYNGDDTAANNIRFYCSSLGNPNDYIQGDGMDWGDWTAPQRCYADQGICAIRTQQEVYMGDDGDDTMLNNVRFECCDMNLTPSESAIPASAPNPQENVTTVADLNIFPEAKLVNIPELRKAILADFNSQIFNKTQEPEKRFKFSTWTFVNFSNKSSN